MIWPGVRLLPTAGPYVPDMDEVNRTRFLTFMQPYASAIVGDGGMKRYENRPNPVPKHLAGRALFLGIHAGLGWYEGADDAIRRWKALPGTDPRGHDYRAWMTAPMTRDGYPKTALLGFARVVGCVDFEEERRVASGGGFASPESRRYVQGWLARRDVQAWAFGPAVVILDPTVLRLPKPIPLPRGALGWWAADDRRVGMSPALQEQVRASLLACLRDRSTWRTAA